LDIHPGQEQAYAAAIREVSPILMSSKGYIRHELHHCIETPTRLILFVYWETVEDHTVGFRGSQKFIDWRAVLNQFYATPPVVEHYTEVFKLSN
jgi:heme-degrading monooxygenase HmoA